MRFDKLERLDLGKDIQKLESACKGWWKLDYLEFNSDKKHKAKQATIDNGPLTLSLSN